MNAKELLDRIEASEDELAKLRRIVEAWESEESILDLPTVAGIVPLADLTKREILRAVVALKGNVVEAAKRLGIGKTTLYRKLKSYEPPIKTTEEAKL